MSYNFHYNIDIPGSFNDILEQDFWLLENVNRLMIASLKEPVKFAAWTWIFVERGECKAELSLISYEIKAPALVLVKNQQILTPQFISQDFLASIIVMSKRFTEDIFMHLSGTPLYSAFSRHPVVSIPDDAFQTVRPFISELKGISENPQNPFGVKALVYSFTSYIYKELYKCFDPFKDENITNQGRMIEQFINLAQENFRNERFLEFYADKLEVTPKHLSRTMKKHTGYTAVEWIEKFVILEAKVLLKSSNLNIQQISDELNFPSQSFFGKYFKKYTGMSPKEFRNS